MVEHVEVRPGLQDLAELRPVVVSAGFHELIWPVLEPEDRVEVLANRVDCRTVARYHLRDEAARQQYGWPVQARQCRRGAVWRTLATAYSDNCAALAA